MRWLGRFVGFVAWIAIIYYAGGVWLNWSDKLVYALIAAVVVISPLSWIADERKRSRKQAGAAA